MLTKEFLEDNVAMIPEAGCWIWLGYLENNGYARYSRDGRFVHREAYTVYHGEPPADCFVLHRCNNRACVSPAHLYAGTQSDNIRQMYFQIRGPFQVLTPEDVLAIRASKAKCRILATHYGVTHQQISSIRTRKRWGWL